jgi:hypothetical protein
MNRYMNRYLNNDSYHATTDFAEAYNRGDLRTARKALENNVDKELSPTGSRRVMQNSRRAGRTALHALNVYRNLTGLADIYGPIDRS